jgi:hypothetical protein
MNVSRKEGFEQVCVWPGTLVGADSQAEFEAFVLAELGTRVQYLEEVATAPDYKNGFPVEGTGGRNDVLFAVHNDDIAKFAVPRFQYGMRWLEDVYGNGSGNLYPERIAEYQTWDYA